MHILPTKLFSFAHEHKFKVLKCSMMEVREKR